jgi:hypothetical protein
MRHNNCTCLYLFHTQLHTAKSSASADENCAMSSDIRARRPHKLASTSTSVGTGTNTSSNVDVLVPMRQRVGTIGTLGTSWEQLKHCWNSAGSIGASHDLESQSQWRDRGTSNH